MWDIWNTDIAVPEKDEYTLERREKENTRFVKMFNRD